MALAASVDGKPLLKRWLSLSTGLILIAVGALLALSTVPVSRVLEQAGVYRAELARRQHVWYARQNDARLARQASMTIDQTWIDYDLLVLQVVRSYDDADPADARSIAAFRQLLLAQLADQRPAAMLARMSGPVARDPHFQTARAMFFSVYDDFQARMSPLCAMLGARLAAPGRDLGVSDADLRAIHDLSAEEAVLRERWSAVSIAARVASDEAQQAREAARQRLDEQTRKNLVERLLAP